MRSWNDPNEKMIQNSILYWLTHQPDMMAMQINTTGVFDPIKKRYRAPGRFVIRGTPDVIACVNCQGLPIFIGFEVKSPKGRQSEHQKLFQQRLERKSGGFYFVVRSIQETEIAIKLVKQKVSLILNRDAPTI